ncbi:MAG: flagellar hook assembly protein FlgD [Caulobacterales bacterium]
MVTAVQNTSNYGTQAQTSAQGLADNYQTFITLLTAQLQNQDPLKPTDSNEFVQQLTAFSGVEQQIRASDQLEKLVALQQGAATGTAVSYLGKSVTLESPTQRLDATGNATWSYSLPTTATANKISIYDSAGKVVFTAKGETKSGIHSFEWDGKSAEGDRLPAGNYRMVIDASDISGEDVTASINVKGTVKAVDLSSGTPMVETSAGAFPLERVLRVDA